MYRTVCTVAGAALFREREHLPLQLVLIDLASFILHLYGGGGERTVSPCRRRHSCISSPDTRDSSV